VDIPHHDLAVLFWNPDDQKDVSIAISDDRNRVALLSWDVGD
jgi:hypothetical protein